jgi:TolB-like protein/tetratricopeptide (TPR) repeat protein
MFAFRYAGRTTSGPARGRGVNKPGAVTNEDRRPSRPVFVSYATPDRKQALSLCKAIERRGTKCWLSTRDVAPGGNYQEEIVRAIRDARAMVLVFSEAANNSDEIKKELSLASRFHVPVIALRIEDVQPSDAFAYELSTRQWIDAFNGWDTSIDSLVHRIGDMPASDSPTKPSVPTHGSKSASASPRRIIVAAVGIAIILLTVVFSWWWLRPTPGAAHSMQVRLTGFTSLSSDLPPTISDTMRDEIIAAFADDGVIAISTAPAAAPGSGPAYALGGTIRHDGNKIRVIARLTNERTGTTLWSNDFTYGGEELPKVPRHIAVDAGTVVRCGLFGASTYRRQLPDPVLADYMQYCYYGGPLDYEPTRGLEFAKRVVSAVPDFSWGWSAITFAAADAYFADPQNPQAESWRSQGLDAAARALRIDDSNSEALAFKSVLVDRANLIGREGLFRQALRARPLSCGCEHLFYGLFLQEVGRISDASQQYQRSAEIIPLEAAAQQNIAEALLVLGRPGDAKSHLESAIDLAPTPNFAGEVTVYEAVMTRDYAGALDVLRRTDGVFPSVEKAPLIAGFVALQHGDAAAKARAIQLLSSTNFNGDGYLSAQLLATLGADHETLKVVTDAVASNQFGARGWFWYPSMNGVIRDPAFPTIADRLGLMNYWRTTRTKPDVCSAKDAPPFCRMI